MNNENIRLLLAEMYANDKDLFKEKRIEKQYKLIEEALTKEGDRRAEELENKVRDLCIQEQIIEIEKTRPKAMDMTDKEYLVSCGKSEMAMKILSALKEQNND